MRVTLPKFKFNAFSTGQPAQPIGVYVGPTALQLLQLRHNGGSARHIAKDLPFGRDQLLEHSLAATQLVKACLQQQKFRGRNVVSALPPNLVRVVTVTYNTSNDNDAAIARLMEQRLDGPLEQYVLDYVPIRESATDSEQLALVAAARRQDVVAYLDIFRRARLSVSRLEIAPVAIRRVVETLYKDNEPSNVLVLNTGVEASFLSMISGKRLLSDQRISIGEDALLERLASALDMSATAARKLVFDNGLSPVANADQTIVDIERVASSEVLVDILRPQFVEIAREVEHAFVYAASESRGDRARRIYLMGALAEWPGIADTLQDYTRIPVQLMGNEVAPLIGATASDKANPNALMVALGLALSGGEYA